MGIRLDWEVQSEGGSEAVAEDATALAAQRRKQIITQRSLIFGVLAAIIIAVVFAIRVRQVRTQMLESLQATVEAETLALRIGNEDRFMLLQGASADWRSEQRRNFDIFQNANPVMIVTDEILELQMNGDEARVTVRVLVGEVEGSATWLYGYSTENGWRHIGTEAEPWARQVIEGDGYRIEYEITDQAMAAKVDEIMGEWWNSAIILSGMTEPMPITIVLDDQKQRMLWDDKGETRLILPSRDDDGQERDLFDPAFYRAFAMWMADRWVRHVLNDRVFAPEDVWVEAETQLWMRQIFDPQAVTPPVFSQLTNAFGVDLVPHLLRTLREEPEISISAAMDQAMTLSAPGAVVPGRMDRYTTRMLQAEFMFEQAWGHSESFQRASSSLFVARNRPDTLQKSQIGLYSGRLEPGSISVFNVEAFGDLRWARTRFNYYIEMWPGSDTITESMLLYVPFIERNGYWVHTWPTVSDWGEPITISADSEQYRLQFYELETAHLSAPGAFGVNVLSLHKAVCADFGVEDVPYLDLMISPNPMGSRTLPTSLDLSSPLMRIEIPSIFSYWGTLEDDSQFHYNKAGAEIVRMVYEYQASGGVPILISDNYIPRAIMEWEMDRQGVDYAPWPVPAIYPPEAYLPDTLEGIWGIEGNVDGHVEHAENTAQYIGAKVLVEMLIEQFGVEALPAMIENSASLYSADVWLQESVGIDAADIEAEWLARYREQLAAYGVTNLIPQE